MIHGECRPKTTSAGRRNRCPYKDKRVKTGAAHSDTVDQHHRYTLNVGRGPVPALAALVGLSSAGLKGVTGFHTSNLSANRRKDTHEM